MNMTVFLRIVKVFALVAFLAVLLAVVMLPSNPLENLPHRDDGVFLYGGREVLAGHTPYIDFWDHKGPSIYYINALGLYVGHGSRWGVWGMEYLLLFLTTLLLYKISRDRWGDVSAFASVCFFAYIIFQIGPYNRHESNFTETYSVFFNMLAVYIWLWLRKKNSPDWHFLLVGALCAVSFLFRPNNMGMVVGMAISGVFDVIYKRERKDFGHLCFVLGGFLLVILGVSAVFLLKGIFAEFADALFFYNLKYSTSGTSSVSDFLRNSEFRTFWYISLFAYVLVTTVFLMRIFFKPLKCLDYFPESLIVFAWPLEIYLISVSGRIYPHYLIILFPYLGWMMGAVIKIVFPAVNEYKHTFVMPTFFLLSFVVVFCFSIFNPHFMRVANYMLRDRKSGVDASNVIVRYVKENSSQADAVLVWGNDVWINFLSGRRSPTKYMYQYPLFLSGYSDANKVNSFVADLKRDPPKLVVAILSVDSKEIIPFDGFMNHAAPDLQTGLPHELENVFIFFNENYCVRAKLKDATIYQFKSTTSLDVPCR